MLCSWIRQTARVLSGPVIVASIALVAIPAAASAATPCANAIAATSAMSSSNQSACWRPFTASSPINTALPTSPALASDNSAVGEHMAQYGWHFGDSTSGFTFSESDGTRPVYFGSPSDPTMTIDCTDEEGPNTCQGENGINVNGAQVHVPAGAQPGNNWDAHMIIVETATGEEYDLWHVTISGNTITSGTGSVLNTNTTNGLGSSGDAAGIALTAGLLRPSELASGYINHALVIDVPCTDATGANVGYSYPATNGWGEACGDYWNESTTGAPTIGQLFKLNMTPTQIANSGAPTWEQTIMTALATYGAYAEDTNGSYHSENITILSQDPTSFTSIGQPNKWNTAINQLGGHNGTLSSSIPIPVSNLVTVNPCVPQGTCPNASGPTSGPTAHRSAQAVAHAASVARHTSARRARARADRRRAPRTHAKHAGRTTRAHHKSRTTRKHHRRTRR
jgi:hypothetical protein